MVIDSFKDKKIVLGITGGIAAYKACYIVRELVTRGAEVKCVMTPSATEFITPLTLSTLSGNEVIVETFPDNQKSGVDLKTWHIETALWADLMIIAPLTVNTLAKIVNGFADNALTTLVLALRGKLLAAPAADMDMYNKPITSENLNKLKEMGTFIVEAEEGFLASGLQGAGRMADVYKIIDASELVLNNYDKDLENQNIIITAGPTYEDIDPVRFIGNRSSGKMGYELAKAAFLRGADVKLISGPVNLSVYPEIDLIKVRSANEMQIEIDKNFSDCDALIKSAAVADYKPKDVYNKKIKKSDKLSSIELIENPDILASLKKENQKVVGFALETDNEKANAKLKYKKKKMDMIVVNSLKDEGAGFEHSTNKITVISEDYEKEYPLMSKFQTANAILSELKKVL